MSGSQADFWQGPTGTLPVVNANGNIFEEVQVATAAQTLFTLVSFTYTVGQKSVWVFRRPVATDIGGEMLRRTVDYTETSSSSITLAAGATVGDTLIFIAFGVNQLIAPVVNNGLPQGGAAGAILTKASGSDYDANWIAQSSITTLLDAVRANIASASTVNLVAIQGTTRNINITGNIQIDGFQITNGEVWAVRFAGALILKNNANITTNTGADVVTAANATCFLRAIADNTVEVISYSAPNGPLLASNLNTGPFGRRNFFKNGGMTNNQRGSNTLAASGTIVGALDCWNVSISGTTVAATVSQSTTATSSTGCGLSVVTTTTGATTIDLIQRIESKNSRKLSAKSITVSGRLRHNAASALNLVATFSKPNVIDNFGALTVIGSAAAVSIPNGSVDTVFSSTITLGANDADNGLQVDLIFSGIAALTAVTFIYTDLQLEIGSIATPTEFIPASVTDIECKRYLRCTSAGTPKGAVTGAHSGVAVTTSILICPMQFNPAMRVAPAAQLWNNGTQNQIRNTGSGATQANTISGIGGNNANGFSAISFTSATLVAGNGYDFDLILSSEL